MNTLQASRRGFLSNLAILSAGVAIGGNTSALFTAKHNEAPGLESIWKSFCKSQLATPYSGVIENRNEIEACKGHEHREGNAMYFPVDKLIAQPIWIYWSPNNKKPADVLVNFYVSGGTVVCINQFELKALLDKQQSDPVRKLSLAADLSIKNGQGLSLIKTIINNNKATIHLA